MSTKLISIRLIPNLLCIFRIFSAFSSVVLLAKGYRIIAIAIVFLGAISDFFDGYIARKYDAVSKLGALLDPLADKIFANMMLWGIWFHTPNITLFVLASLSTIRDMILVMGSAFIVKKRINTSLKPIFISKVCTSIVFTYITVCLICNPSDKYINLIGVVSILLVVITGCQYLLRYVRNSLKFS